eukprot:scaffold1085_cov407-Prasinococcus_capsulatus_cf.AAC.79
MQPPDLMNLRIRQSCPTVIPQARPDSVQPDIACTSVQQTPRPGALRYPCTTIGAFTAELAHGRGSSELPPLQSGTCGRVPASTGDKNDLAFNAPLLARAQEARSDCDTYQQPSLERDHAVCPSPRRT